MPAFDDVADINNRYWDEQVRRGRHYTKAWLDLDAEAIRRYAAGEASTLPGPFGRTADGDLEDCDRIMTADVAGKDVLCLASGGGQQSAVFALLGARVTVVDLCEGQLEADRQAARHYGYELRAVRADMRDLSAFADASFDRVCQPVSICFVPDVREVYAEVARVLTPGGLYRVDHCNPATYPASFDGPDNGWDGTGYRLAEPYRGGPVRVRPDGSENMREGEMTGEFRHLLSDIFNGLIEAGLAIEGVWDRRDHLRHDPTAAPGSDRHRLGIVAEYFQVLARKS